MLPVTVIVFAREPRAGSAKTRLVPALGREGAAALADAFIRDTLAKVERLHPARLVIAGSARGDARRSAYFRALAHSCSAHLDDQGPGDLGARMARMLAHYAACAGAILMGTDTPSLAASAILESVRLLDRSPVVLGPALDGGYYLIGVRGGPLDIFRGIAWGTGRVLADTLRRLREANISYALGPWWYDVDLPSDLALLRAHLDIALPRRAMRALPLTLPYPCPHTAAALRRLTG
jgi:rSAM/selenodomain-associated transferase 1